MLSGGYSAVMQARNRDEFRDEIVRFARELGFETVSAITVIDHGLNNREFVVVDNTPLAYVESSNDSTSYKRDPVMQHCKLQSLPIIWDQRTYVDNGVVDVYGIPLKNWDDNVYGLQTMTGVLQNSINTGAVFMEQKLGQPTFHRYLDAFGFGTVDDRGTAMGQEGADGFVRDHFLQASVGFRSLRAIHQRTGSGAEFVDRR